MSGTIPCSHGDSGLVGKWRVNKNKCLEVLRSRNTGETLPTRGTVPNFTWVDKESLHKKPVCFQADMKGKGELAG